MKRYTEITLYSVLYIVLIFCVECLGFIGPFWWAYNAGIATLVAWIAYRPLFKLMSYGAALLPVGLLALLSYMMGEADMLYILIALTAALLSEALRTILSKKGEFSTYVVSYMLFALVPYASTLRMWVDRDASYPIAVEEMGQAYADTLMAITPMWACPVAIVITLLLAFFVATIPVLFKNQGKPEGWFGRLVVRSMNKEHAPIHEFGRSHVQIKGDEYILEVGCGGGSNLAAFLQMSPNIRAIGVDYSEDSVKASSQYNAKAISEGRCEVRQGNVLHLEFEDNRFDLVTAFETVYFWPDIVESFREVHRVLKPGGQFLICNEVDGETKRSSFFPKLVEGMTNYTQPMLTELLEKSGFTDIECHRNKDHNLCVIAKA